MVKVTAAIIFKNGKLLIAQRPPGDPLEYKWELPGGKIEKNETPEECLARELFEEFNITVKIKKTLYDFRISTHDDIFIELMAFNTQLVGGKMQNKFHKKFKWVSIGEINNYDFAEADIEIVNKLKRKHNCARAKWDHL